MRSAGRSDVKDGSQRWPQRFHLGSWNGGVAPWGRQEISGGGALMLVRGRAWEVVTVRCH